MRVNWSELWNAAAIRACLPCPARPRPVDAFFDGVDRLHSAGLQAQHSARGLCLVCGMRLRNVLPFAIVWEVVERRYATFSDESCG